MSTFDILRALLGLFVLCADIFLAGLLIMCAYESFKKWVGW